jgi:hypothetical protein
MALGVVDCFSMMILKSKDARLNAVRPLDFVT